MTEGNEAGVPRYTLQAVERKARKMMETGHPRVSVSEWITARLRTAALFGKLRAQIQSDEGMQ